MDKHEDNIDNLLNKLRVLNSRIHRLETLSNELLNEVKETYERQIAGLNLKKDIIQETILKIKKISDNKQAQI